jgi:hypothetical protein
MSGPNTNYDPVEVTPLSPDEVTRMRDEALAAIAAAQTLDELKDARIAHFGDRAPLAPRSGRPWPTGPPPSKRTGTGVCCWKKPST